MQERAVHDPVVLDLVSAGPEPAVPVAQQFLEGELVVSGRDRWRGDGPAGPVPARGGLGGAVSEFAVPPPIQAQSRPQATTPLTTAWLIVAGSVMCCHRPPE